MTDSREIIGKIDGLIDLVATDQKMEKAFKLRLIRLLLGLKLELLGFFTERKAVSPGAPGGKREKTGEKERLILKFIGEKGGRVGMDDLAALGMSGRSLRRYLMDLRKRGLIEVEKKGREHFYKLI